MRSPSRPWWFSQAKKSEYEKAQEPKNCRVLERKELHEEGSPEISTEACLSLILNNKPCVHTVKKSTKVGKE